MHIFGKKIVLRAIEESDLELLQKWSNDPSIQGMLGGWHFPISAQDQKKWFSDQSFDSINQRFIIHIDGIGSLGTISLTNIDWINRTAFYGILIGDDAHRNKGYALDACLTLLRFAFNEVGLERVDTEIIEYNKASLKFHLDKAGWKREGIKSKWFYRNGKRWDKIIVGITKENYIEHCNKINYWNK